MAKNDKRPLIFVVLAAAFSIATVAALSDSKPEDRPAADELDLADKPVAKAETARVDSQIALAPERTAPSATEPVPKSAAVEPARPTPKLKPHLSESRSPKEEAGEQGPGPKELSRKKGRSPVPIPDTEKTARQRLSEPVVATGFRERLVYARERAGTNYEKVAMGFLDAIDELYTRRKPDARAHEMAALEMRVGKAWTGAAQQYRLAAQRWRTAHRLVKGQNDLYKSEGRRLNLRAQACLEQAVDCYERAANLFEEAELSSKSAEAWDKAAELNIEFVATAKDE